MAFMQYLRGLWRLQLFVALNNTDQVTTRLNNEQLLTNHAWLTYYPSSISTFLFRINPLFSEGSVSEYSNSSSLDTTETHERHDLYGPFRS